VATLKVSRYDRKGAKFLTNYFASLARNTGLDIGPAKSPGGGPDRRQPPEKPPGPAIEFEQHVMAEGHSEPLPGQPEIEKRPEKASKIDDFPSRSPAGRTAEQPSKKIGEASDRTAKSAGRKPLRRPPENVSKHPLTQAFEHEGTTRSTLSDVENSEGPAKSKGRRQRSIAPAEPSSDKNVQGKSSRRSAGSSENPPKETYPHFDEATPAMGILEKVETAPAGSTRPRDRAPGESRLFIQKRPDGDRPLGKENVVGAVLRQVRDWVAQQPALTTEEQRSRVIEEAVAQAKQAMLPALDKKPRQKAFPKGAPEKTPGKTECDACDIHVSIGPLNVTVEAPENTERAPMPPVKADASPARPSRSSRLNRRYIKL
jgi:hypothetical protein